MEESSSPRSDESFELRSALGVAFVSLIVGFGFYLLGFLSTGWTKTTQNGYEFSEGLWELCAARSNFDLDNDGWHMATRAMMTLSLMCLLASLLLLCGLIFVKRLAVWRKSLTLIIPLVAMASFVLCLIGLIIYGTKRSPHWSYGMTVIASACVLTSSVFMVIAFCSKGRGL